MSTALVSSGTWRGCATLELARPERGNSLSSALVAALTNDAARSFADPSVHTVLLRGAGKHFCTGFDLDGLTEQSDGDLLHRFVQIELLLSSIWHAPVLTAAIGSGRVWGAGADLFAACSVRLALPESRFRFPGAQFGIVLGTRRLAERIGEERARRWVTESAEIDAAAAMEAGLVTAIVPAGELDAWISENLQEPAVDRATVQALHAATRPDLRDRDLADLVRSAATPGLRERISAYAGRARNASPDAAFSPTGQYR